MGLRRNGTETYETQWDWYIRDIMLLEHNGTETYETQRDWDTM